MVAFNKSLSWLTKLPIGALMLLVAACTYGDSSRERLTTEETLEFIEGGLLLHHANTGKMPADLSASNLAKEFVKLRLRDQSIESRLRDLKAYTDNAQSFRDGWGKPIEISRIADGRISVVSLGKDGESGTADDLVRFCPR